MARATMRPAEQHARRADEQRGRGVQARHRRIRVREGRDEPALCARAAGLQRVDEAVAEALRQQARGRAGVGQVADDPEREADDHGVPQERPGVVAPQVDPQQEAERDRELALEVRPVRDLEHESRRVHRPVLDGLLAEDAERLLGRDHVLRVADRGRARAVREAARRLVGDVEGDEQRELAQEVAPAAGQLPPDRVDHAAQAARVRGRLRWRLPRANRRVSGARFARNDARGPGVRRGPSCRVAACRPARLLAAQEREDVLGRGVRLGEHRGTRLREDLQLGEVDRLRGDVDVADAALCGGDVLLVDAEVVDGVLEAVLDGAEGGAGARDVGDGLVDRRTAPSRSPRCRCSRS